MKRRTKKHSRVGARTQVRLKKWSDKEAQASESQASQARSTKSGARRTLDAAKAKLRQLFV